MLSVVILNVVLLCVKAPGRGAFFENQILHFFSVFAQNCSFLRKKKNSLFPLFLILIEAFIEEVGYYFFAHP
jgi:hypothetical protein